MVTKYETFFILVMTLPILGHVIILPMMIDVVGRDAWISILLSLPFAFLYLTAIYYVKVKYPREPIRTLLFTLMGKVIGRIFIYILIFYFLFVTILSITVFVDFVFILFIPDTPIWAIVIWFSIFVLYAAYKGMKVIALAAGILTFIALFTGHTITLLDSTLKEWGNLLPILEYGWNPVLAGTLIIISVWIELILLLCLPMKSAKEKGVYLLWSAGVSLNLLMMLSTLTGAITIFGLGQVENMLYPAQEIVRMLNLGFLDRFDVYGMILHSFGTFIRCSLYFRIVFELCMRKSPTTRYKVTVFVILAIIIIGASLYLTHNHLLVERGVVIYVYLFILYPLPFLLLLRAKYKKSS